MIRIAAVAVVPYFRPSFLNFATPHLLHCRDTMPVAPAPADMNPEFVSQRGNQNNAPSRRPGPPVYQQQQQLPPQRGFQTTAAAPMVQPMFVPVAQSYSSPPMLSGQVAHHQMMPVQQPVAQPLAHQFGNQRGPQRGGYGDRQGHRGGRGHGGRPGPGSHQQAHNQQHPIQRPASEIPPAPRKIEPDAELIRQFQERYANQEEASDKSHHEMLDVDACCRMIDANDVTFVVTDTGTGKSSLIPKALVSNGARVVSSQPRRTAAINLALRVADLLGENVGDTVGYCVRGERVGDDKQPLMYMTSYTVLLHVISHPTDLKYTHFVIDEFHERQADVEVLLSLLKLAKQQKQLPIKIVLMSASVELEAWKGYFDGLSIGEYNTCKPRYSVHDYYAEEVCRLLGAALHDTPKGDIVQSLALQNCLHLTERMLSFLAQNTAPEHCVLVFLPGRTNVEQMASWIAKHHAEQLEPIQWYRDVELSTIHAAVNRPAGRKKKVYLATDIAEVSITLPDVVFVIDSGTTKKPRIDPKSKNSVAFPALELLWCSRSAVAQRRGRVGRVQQGFFFTMIRESQLPQLADMEPQIANSRINELSLHVLEIAANPLAVFNLGRTTPKLESVQLSMNTLLDGGCAMLSSHPNGPSEAMDNEDAKPWTVHIMKDPTNAGLRGETFVTTVKGIITQHLPLNIECSTIVFMGLVFGLEPIMILAGAIAACGTPFYTFGAEDSRQAKSPELREAAAKIIRSLNCGVKSDIISAIDICLQYKALKLEGLTTDAEAVWCREHSVSTFRLQNILTLEKQIKNQLAEQLSYRDIEDTDQLRGMLHKNALSISLMVAASHLERGIFVTNDQRKQQQQKTAGPCIFLGLKAQKDEFVASSVKWDIGTVVIPLSLQLRYDRLLGSFSTELMPRQYDLLLLCFTHDVVLQPRRDEQGEFAVFGVELQGQRLMFRCGAQTSATILEFRRLVGCKYRGLRVLVESKVPISETENVQSLYEKLIQNSGAGPQSSPAFADLSNKLLQAMEFIFSPQYSAKLDITTYRGDDFVPTLHSMFLTTATGVLPLPARVQPAILAETENAEHPEAPTATSS